MKPNFTHLKNITAGSLLKLQRNDRNAAIELQRFIYHNNSTIFSRDQHIAVLINEVDRTYELLDPPTNLSQDTPFCLTIFSYENGNIVETPLVALHISPFNVYGI